MSRFDAGLWCFVIGALIWATIVAGCAVVLYHPVQQTIIYKRGNRDYVDQYQQARYRTEREMQDE